MEGQVLGNGAVAEFIAKAHLLSCCLDLEVGKQFSRAFFSHSPSDPSLQLREFSENILVALGRYFKCHAASLNIDSLFLSCVPGDYCAMSDPWLEIYEGISALSLRTLIINSNNVSQEIVDILSQNYTLQMIADDGDRFRWIQNRNKFLKKQKRFASVKQAAE